MKYLSLATLVLVSTLSHADVSCRAIYREIWASKPSVEESVEMKQTELTTASVTIKGEIRGRTLVLASDLKSGDSLLSQVWGPEFTNGVNTSGTFGSSGRLALSTITDLPGADVGEVGTVVYRVECTKK